MQTGLLTLHDAGVAGEEASLLQCCAVGIAVDGVEGTSHAQADCAGLACGAATVDEHDCVELTFELQEHDRRVHFTLEQLRREVLLERTAIDLPLASARNQANTGDGFLTTAGAIARSDRGGAGACARVGLGGEGGGGFLGLGNRGVVGILSHCSYLLRFTLPAARSARSRRPEGSGQRADALRRRTRADGSAGPLRACSSAACP